jgi:hypothetical protein
MSYDCTKIIMDVPYIEMNNLELSKAVSVFIDQGKCV